MKLFSFGGLVLPSSKSVCNGAISIPISDRYGKLILWHTDDNGPFDYIMDIEARWWLKAPKKNGWPVYLTASKLTRTYEQFNGAHLLRSTSVITNTAYHKETITYSVFDNSSKEKLKLNSAPKQVRVNGTPDFAWEWDSTSQVLFLNRNHGNSIEIL